MSGLGANSPTITDAGRAYLRWALTDGVGPRRFAKLLIAFGSAEKALGATAGEIEKIHGIGRDGAERVAQGRDVADVEFEIEAAAAHDVRIVAQVDPEYPIALKKMDDPPIVLYMRGTLLQTDALSIAIVGSRKCSIYGSEQARRFGELCAGVGLTVVSGLARGIDSFAHHGAVDAGGRSIAVMGNGLDAVYPPENKALAMRVLDHGAWLSELPIRAAVRASNFPSRNRIIAGMTLGTLVVEAAKKSGALITARLAQEYNREVFAVPGRLGEVTAQGTNALIRDGAAKLVTALEDILMELGEVGIALRQKLPDAPAAAAEHYEDQGDLFGETREPSAEDARDGDEASPQAEPASRDAPVAPKPTPGGLKLSNAERVVLDAVAFEPLLQDFVIRTAGLPPGEVLAAFTTLEMKGLIKRLPGQLVARIGQT